MAFEFIFTEIRYCIKPVDMVEMQNAMDAQRKYWKVDEANTPAQKKISTEESNDDIENKTYLIDDEALSGKIVEHIS